MTNLTLVSVESQQLLIILLVRTKTKVHNKMPLQCSAKDYLEVQIRIKITMPELKMLVFILKHHNL